MMFSLRRIPAAVLFQKAFICSEGEGLCRTRKETAQRLEQLALKGAVFKFVTRTTDCSLMDLIGVQGMIERMRRARYVQRIADIPFIDRHIFPLSEKILRAAKDQGIAAANLAHEFEEAKRDYNILWSSQTVKIRIPLKDGSDIYRDISHCDGLTREYRVRVENKS
jgi:hypothetical protein